MQFIRLIGIACLAAILAACAGGGSTGQTDAGSSPPEDASEDAAADTAVDAADVTPDVSDVNDDPCGECCPGETICVDSSTLGTCADDGSEYLQDSCGEGNMCEQGACVAEPVCTAGETKCQDGSTRLVCRASETGWRAESCSTGEGCIDGECLTGAPNGTFCTTDSDCAGGACRCRSDESCDPQPSWSYCTAPCTPGSCAPDEICIASESFNGANFDHCVKKCDQTCPLENLQCVNLPTRDTGELTYESGCYFEDAVDIGEECSSDAECTGGECLTGYFDQGLCTYECTGNCPDGTACVELELGKYHCTPLCGDGSASTTEPCPLDPDDNRFDVSCELRTLFSGNSSKNVCVTP